jgi:hypothetical protein
MSSKEKEFFLLKMEINMRANFKMITFMVTELLFGKMVIIMREIGLMIKRQEKEKHFILMIMGINMRAKYMMLNFMVSEFIYGKMVLNMREIG